MSSLSAADLAALSAAQINTAQSTTDLNAVLTQLDNSAKALAGSIGAVTLAYPALFAAQKLFNSEIYGLIIGGSQEMSKVPRMLASEIMGANVLLSEHMTSANDAMTRNALALQRAAYADQEALTTRQVKIGEENGKAIMGYMVDYFKTSADLGEAFYKGAMDETRLYDAALQATTQLGQEKLYRMKETSSLAMKGLEMNARDMTALFQEEFSKTGKISGETVEKFSATILAASKETGLGIRQLTSDSTRMLSDVERFGNMTYSQMTSLSAAIHRLGLDMEDVTRVTDKFVSFENASQAIANIGAVTGATLDTMEMFYLANEDKEEFFRTMRQSLLDQGVTLENLSHQEQVYLSKQLGFSSVRQLQSLLNEEIDFTTGNITDKIEQAASSQEYVGDKLTEQLAQAGGLAKETLDAMSPEGIMARLSAVKDLAGGTSQLFDATVKLKTGLGTMASEALPALSEATKTFKTGFVLAMDASLDKAKALAEWWKVFAGGPFPKSLLPSSVPDAYVPFVKGIETLVSESRRLLSKMPADIQTKFSESSKITLEQVAKTSEDAAKLFSDLRKSHEAQIKDIDKFEKQLIEEQGVRLREANAVRTAYENSMLSYTPEETKKRLLAKFGDVEGQQLTDKDVGDLFEGFTSGDAGVLAKVAVGNLSTKLEEARAQFGTGATATPPTSSAPTTPSAPGSGVEPGATPGTTATPTGFIPVPATADGNLNIKVKLDLDQDALKEIIRAEIDSTFDGGVTFNLPKGNYSGGKYKFVLEEVS